MRALDMKHRATTVALFLALIGAVGALVIVLGGAPIRASSGHWPITRWFLKFSKDRAVATQSWGIEAPPLDDQDRIVRGAGHYETACASCHGSPLRLPSPVTQSATPAPPNLAELVPQREPRELFYVVQHGILFTGMPAWPADGREDEIWDTVAFLLRLPSMGGAEYQELVSPFKASGIAELGPSTPAKVALCGRCHGLDGLGREKGEFPRLAGQQHDYLLASLDAYALGTRHSGVMQAAVAEISPTERRELALYYASLPGTRVSRSELASESMAEAQSAIKRGREIAVNGIPSLGVPSCRDCHGPDALQKSEDYPLLVGLPVEYLENQLRLFLSGRRGGGPHRDLMRPVASHLPLESISDVATFYSMATAAGIQN